MNATKPFPEIWEPIEREMRTYYRALPQLLKDGRQNKYVVVRGEETFQVCDNYAEASQFGHRTYADGKFIIQPVDRTLITASAYKFA